MKLLNTLLKNQGLKDFVILKVLPHEIHHTTKGETLVKLALPITGDKIWSYSKDSKTYLEEKKYNDIPLL